MQSSGDYSPALSPDGKRVAFTRSINIARRDIFVLPLTADLSPSGEPMRVTDRKRIVDTMAWSSDGRQLYFAEAASVSGARHIMRVDAGGGLNAGLSETGIEGVHPVVSPDGRTLCYVRSNIEQSSIWRLDLGKDGVEAKRAKLISSTRRDYTADLSPHGKRLVFSSVRSGTSEIWVSDLDGSNLKQITRRGRLRHGGRRTAGGLRTSRRQMDNRTSTYSTWKRIRKGG
jgi:Tol biopolymer transport system component